MQTTRGKQTQGEELPKVHIDWFVKPVTRFIKIETASGGALLIATLIAVIFANSSFSEPFFQFWATPVGFSFGEIELKRSIHKWINDGAMTIFFFLVALELKRELILGELRSPKLAMLSISAAIGGMIVPVLIFVVLQFDTPPLNGWGVVMSTDTAFVLGCLALLGKSIPKVLRVFMLSLAVVDDIGAILAVAIGYSSTIDSIYIGFAVVGLITVKAMAHVGIRSFMIYLAIGGVIWLAIDSSGFHPTIAGVILGLMTPTVKWVDNERLHNIITCITSYPLSPTSEGSVPYKQALKTAEAAAREALSPVERLENILHPWVGFVIMPLFALSNAGIIIKEANTFDFLAITIFISLVLGKPLGIILFSWFAVKTRIAVLPESLNWHMLLGGSLLAGVSFTMALFIADLALQAAYVTTAKLAIIIASITSAFLGCLFLKYLSISSNINKLEGSFEK